MGRENCEKILSIYNGTIINILLYILSIVYDKKYLFPIFVLVLQKVETMKKIHIYS